MKILFIFVTLISSTAFAKKDNTSTSGGRFQLIQLSDMRRDQHLIDTQTGKIWSSICMVNEGGNCEMDAWMPDHVVGVTISEAELYKRRNELRKFIDEDKKIKAAQQAQQPQ